MQVATLALSGVEELIGAIVGRVAKEAVSKRLRGRHTLRAVNV